MFYVSQCIDFWPLIIFGLFFFLFLFSLFGLPTGIGMERPDPDCTLNIEKILVGNDLGIKLHNTAPDVPTVRVLSWAAVDTVLIICSA